jgi:hypothetical protein
LKFQWSPFQMCLEFLMDQGGSEKALSYKLFLQVSNSKSKQTPHLYIVTADRLMVTTLAAGSYFLGNSQGSWFATIVWSEETRSNGDERVSKSPRKFNRHMVILRFNTYMPWSLQGSLVGHCYQLEKSPIRLLLFGPASSILIALSFCYEW